MTPEIKNALDYKVGDHHKITHRRKGTFKLRVTSQCEEWLHGIVTDRMDAKVYEDETVGVRKEFITRTERLAS